jgi:hypothetical protein
MSASARYYPAAPGKSCGHHRSDDAGSPARKALSLLKNRRWTQGKNHQQRQSMHSRMTMIKAIPACRFDKAPTDIVCKDQHPYQTEAITKRNMNPIASGFHSLAEAVRIAASYALQRWTGSDKAAISAASKSAHTFISPAVMRTICRKTPQSTACSGTQAFNGAYRTIFPFVNDADAVAKLNPTSSTRWKRTPVPASQWARISSFRGGRHGGQGPHGHVQHPHERLLDIAPRTASNCIRPLTSFISAATARIPSQKAKGTC